MTAAGGTWVLRPLRIGLASSWRPQCYVVRARPAERLMARRQDLGRAGGRAVPPGDGPLPLTISTNRRETFSPICAIDSRRGSQT
jgi:hypothetical protein